MRWCVLCLVHGDAVVIASVSCAWGSILFTLEVVVIDEPVGLAELGHLVDDVTAQEQVVLRGDGDGVLHEHGRVHHQGSGHRAGDRFGRLVLQVQDGRNGDAEVRHRAPEVGREDVLQRLLGEDFLRHLLCCCVGC